MVQGYVCGFMLLLKVCFCTKALVKSPAAPAAGRKKDSSSSSEESEDEQPVKAPTPSEFRVHSC